MSNLQTKIMVNKHFVIYLLRSGMISKAMPPGHHMSQLSDVPGSHHEFYVVSAVRLGFSMERMHPLKNRHKYNCDCFVYF